MDHMLDWPRGGFVGVDIFFVISGFLITGLLLREYERTGHISARKFYAGRAKRIFPAATLVLIVTVIVAYLVLTRQRAIGVMSDSIAAFFFVANWDMAIGGTDYFQQGGATSPLQHFWSLSVEEQFYFVWPWMLLGLLVLFARGGRLSALQVRFIAGTSVGAIFAASFSWALITSTTSPTVAYFSTFTRAWELALGALLAVASPLFARIPRKVGVALSYIGLAAMLASCVIITPSTTWPAPWALLPTLATAVVIASGLGRGWSGIWLLTNRPTVYIGNISYSLYLWHFPVIIFGEALFPTAGWWGYLGISIAGVGLAIASYHAVERPIWKSPLWNSSGRHAWREWRRDSAPAVSLGATAGLSIATATLVLLAMASTNAVSVAPVLAAPLQPSSSASPASPQDDLAREVRASLNTSAWPTLTPTIDEVGPSARAAAWVSDGCLALETKAESDFRETTQRCVYGDPAAANTVALIGDSIAISWLPAVEQALSSSSWNIHVITMHQCPYTDVSVTTSNGSAHPDCDEFHEWAREEVDRIDPEMVIVSQLDAVVDRLVDGGGESEFEERTVATLEAFSAPERTITVLSAPPAGVPLEQCYTAIGSPSDCITPEGGTHQRVNEILERSVESFAPSNVSFIDADFMFCSNGRCPAQVSGMVVRADGSHLTDIYSRHTGVALAQLLLAAK
jgi:peptidoglycan/LPS O-acetylase OafA/YrhL